MHHLDAPDYAKQSEVGDHEVLFQAAASTCSHNTRIILTDARYPAIDAFYLVRTGAN